MRESDSDSNTCERCSDERDAHMNLGSVVMPDGSLVVVRGICLESGCKCTSLVVEGVSLAERLDELGIAATAYA